MRQDPSHSIEMTLESDAHWSGAEQETRTQAREPASAASNPPWEETWSAMEKLRREHDRLLLVHRAAEDSIHRHRDLFECCPDGLLTTDFEGTIEETNAAAAILLKAPPERLAGRPLSFFVAPKDRRGFLSRLMRIRGSASRSATEWDLEMHSAGAEAFDAALAVSRLAWPREKGGSLLWALRDVTRRKRMERSLRRSEQQHAALYRQVREHRDQLRKLATCYMHAREDEAKRIAHRLHNDASQITIAAHLTLAEIEGELPPEVRSWVGKAGMLLDRIEERLRQISHELRPTMLDDLGLVPALEFLAAGFSARSGIAVEIRGGTGGRLETVVETAVYRIVQESLTNVARHSRAGRVWIRIRRAKDALRCSIRDDGTGFDARAWRRHCGGGLGLLGIQERIDVLGGTLRVRSSPGNGTEVDVTVPLAKRP